MIRENCMKELIAQNRNYQFLTDKLDIPSVYLKKDWKEVSHYLQLEEKLLKALLLSYDDSAELPVSEFKNSDLKEIIRYLQYSHRYYLNKKLPEIEQTVAHLCQSYRDSHQLLVVLGLFFMDYKNKLEKHIRYEEEVFFPFVVSLVDISKKESDAKEILNILNTYSARQFLAAHSDVEEDLLEVRNLILKYSGDQPTPLPYRIFLNQLQAFENDLSRHALLEDHILLPMVIELEATLLNRVNRLQIHPAG